jgi:hypothetical protein
MSDDDEAVLEIVAWRSLVLRGENELIVQTGNGCLQTDLLLYKVAVAVEESIARRRLVATPG